MTRQAPIQRSTSERGSGPAEWSQRTRARAIAAQVSVRPRRLLVRAALVSGIVLAALGWYFEDSLPAPDRLHQALLAEPVQLPISEPPFQTNANGVAYYLKPRYSYDITGLVVSLHHSDAWWDTAHRDGSDYLNLMDLCVVWGQNASSGIYRNIHFSNSEWSCDFSSRSAADFRIFNLAQVSNNHLLADKPQIARLLKGIHIGDQVRLRGTLVDYGVMRGGVPQGLRVSSDTRTDTGNGACEIVYVTSVELLATAGALPRFALDLGLLLLVIGIGAWFALPVATIGDELSF
jgi:hypothetical protein